MNPDPGGDSVMLLPAEQHPRNARGLRRMNIEVDESLLLDLRNRLRHTRWPSVIGTDDRYGLNGVFLRELVEYWTHEFDWRKSEAAMNRYEHYVVHIDGVPVHFLRRPGATTSSKPLLLAHGWPWTFWHWSKVLEPLADPETHGGGDASAYELIVPSLPGFGLSSPLKRAGINFWRTADIFDGLMTEVLGHRHYWAAGCDVGALVAGQLGHKHSDHVAAIHIGSGQKLTLFNGPHGWNVAAGALAMPDRASTPDRHRMHELERRFAVHLAAQMLAPDTLGHALADSPVGMLAWLLERWIKWSQCRGNIEAVFTKDDLLTHATLYWVTNTITTSMRMYANNNLFPWTPSHARTPVVETPTGVTLVAHENPPGVSTGERAGHFRQTRSDWYNLVHVAVHDRGGHFIPWEIPAEWVADLRSTFERDT